MIMQTMIFVGYSDNGIEFLCFRAQWLTKVGSPGSEIHRCEFTNWEGVSRQQYKGFVIRF